MKSPVTKRQDKEDLLVCTKKIREVLRIDRANNNMFNKLSGNALVTEDQ